MRILTTVIRLFPAVILTILITQSSGFGQVAGDILPAWQPGYLDIHQISTGQGDAAFAVLPDGTTLLIDAGTLSGTDPRTTKPRPNNSRRTGEWIARYISRMMPPNRESALDYALLTHFHGDHMGNVSDDSPLSSTGAYRLTGITDVGDAVPIRKMLDRAWPEYDEPFSSSKQIDNYQNFLQWQSKNNGLIGERFQPGRSDQIILVHNPKQYPEFEIRNIAANGVVWTGRGTATRAHIPPFDEIEPQDRSGENPYSIAFRMTYGSFDYFNGGDIQGEPQDWEPDWHDMETPVARVVGPVDVINHHGWIDAANAFFLSALRPRVHISSFWHVSHLGSRVMIRLLSQRPYKGPRDIFATNMMPEAKYSRKQLESLASEHGHIVVRVQPGGGSYHVITLDDTDESNQITGVFGPYEAQ